VRSGKSQNFGKEKLVGKIRNYGSICPHSLFVLKYYNTLVMFSGFGMHIIVSTSTSRSFGQDLVSFCKSQITFLLLGSTKSGEFLYQLSSYQLLKKLLRGSNYIFCEPYKWKKSVPEVLMLNFFITLFAVHGYGCL
jgi:hypothetical protein